MALPQQWGSGWHTLGHGPRSVKPPQGCRKEEGRKKRGGGGGGGLPRLVGLVIAGFGFANVLPSALLLQLGGGEQGKTHENGFPKKVAERVSAEDLQWNNCSKSVLGLL